MCAKFIQVMFWTVKIYELMMDTYVYHHMSVLLFGIDECCTVFG